MRRFDDQWIASTRVEKFNDWSVASRCKGQGRSWGAAGVTAIAVLVAAERNGELSAFRRDGVLPAWELTGQRTLIAGHRPAGDDREFIESFPHHSLL